MQLLAYSDEDRVYVISLKVIRITLSFINCLLSCLVKLKLPMFLNYTL